MAHRHDFIVVTAGSSLTRPITSPEEYYSEPGRRAARSAVYRRNRRREDVRDEVGMTGRTKAAALALVLLLIAAVVVYQMFFKGPMLMWDGSAGATHYEVQIDGAPFGT